MPLSSKIVGASTQPLTHLVDARWLMAYAAALGDFNPRYMHTDHGTVQAHPVFPVCPEWPVILNTRELFASLPKAESLTPEEAARGVHAAHDLHIYAPITAGDELKTTATMTEVRAIRPGAAYTLRLDTRNTSTNALVARTFQLGIYRGVEVIGEDVTSEIAPTLPVRQDTSAADRQAIEIDAGAAHTYTECARIWNPIHTDRAIALAAGLPDIILHGTATLAFAISAIVNRFADSDPTRVRRLGGRFAAMVLMPSTISLRCRIDANIVSYDVLTETGDTAISQGFVVLDTPV